MDKTTTEPCPHCGSAGDVMCDECRAIAERAESIIGPKGEKLDGDEWERAVTAVERELG